MSGSIVRALNWDLNYEQQFIAVSPIGDEVLLYRTQVEVTGDEPQSLSKVNCRTGFDNIQCSAYSMVDVGLMGVGQISGVVSIFDITASQPGPGFSSDSSGGGTELKLRPKQGRPCNSLSFNNSGLVAAGFDKGRQDSSLQIWNIEHYSRTSNNDHIKRPAYSYLPNEAILSCTFYPDRATNLLAGSYKFLREIDLRQEAPVFQMATRCTRGITINSFVHHYFLTYSEDGTFLIWDRRKLTGGLSNGAGGSGGVTGGNAGSIGGITGNTGGGSVSGKGNVITETPILRFNKLLTDTSRKNRSPCVRSSSIRKGEFAALFNGDLIRRWNTGLVPPLDESPSLGVVKMLDATDSVTSTLKQQAAQLYPPDSESLFVSMVLDAKTDYERVVSFDYSPDVLSSTSAHFVCMRQSGSVFRMMVKESIESVDFNSYNEFVISGPEGTLTKFVEDEQQEQNNIRGNESINNVNRRLSNQVEVESTIEDEDESESESEIVTPYRDTNIRKSSTGADDEYDEDEYSPNELASTLNLGLSGVLTNDICYIIRKRASLGYGVDCEKNIQLLENTESTNTFLINTWKWLLLAKKSLEKGTMISQGLDLGYQGVLGLWNGIEELQSQKRFDKEVGTPVTDQWFQNTIKSIVLSKGKKTAAINIASNSDRKTQRKLCLIVSGWYLADTEFEEKLNGLVSLGMYEKAAGWAVFHGNVLKAVEILASSNKERLRIMSTAVAGYMAYKDSNVNSPWKDQCRRMASELDNPYLRAIFAFIADNDWWDVLDEHSLPLRERLGIALRFLSDKDLTVYLNRIAELVINKGELEGLILTGITPKGIALLQSYVDRTSDVQTATLISSFGCPRYFVDDRVDHWIHCYRDLLNSWSMFNVRAKFDVARTKLSKTFSGQVTVKAAPKQVYLQCIRCNKNISKSRSSSNDGSSGVGGNNTAAILKQFNKMSMTTTNNNTGSGNSGNGFHGSGDFKSCPHCGSPLSRCSICLLSMGTPIPMDATERANDGSLAGRIENNFREWFSFCLSCNHGAHALHAEEWFSKHYVCPVPDCNCRCNSK